MSEILSIEEIESRYAPDWVLLGDIDTGEDARLHAGRVLFHSPSRDEVYRKMGDYPPGRYAVRCLKPWTEEMAILL